MYAGTLLSDVWKSDNPTRNENGRISFVATKPVSNSVQSNFEYPKQTQLSFTNDMLRGNWESTPLSTAFFTRANISAIQEGIRVGVKSRGGSKNYIIDDQDVNELQMIMRGFFLQYAKNSPIGINSQVSELNRMIIEWSIPRIVSEIEQYHFYINDISHLPVPLEQPLHLSSAGTKSLPFQPYM